MSALTTAECLAIRPALIKAVRDQGWPEIEDWMDEQIVSAFGWAESEVSAIKKVRKAAGVISIVSAAAPGAVQRAARCTEKVEFINDSPVSLHYDCPVHASYTERTRYDLISAA